MKNVEKSIFSKLFCDWFVMLFDTLGMSGAILERPKWRGTLWRPCGPMPSRPLPPRDHQSTSKGAGPYQPKTWNPWKIMKILKNHENKGFGLIFSKFPQFHRALLLRVSRVERRATAKNEALDEFCWFPQSFRVGRWSYARWGVLWYLWLPNSFRAENC